MGELTDFTIGQVVDLNGQKAVLRFVGKTQFAPGDWLGVEFDDASGKNDGSVEGQRYFDCPAGHGMFCRPKFVTIVDQPSHKLIKRNSAANSGANAKPRPQSLGAPGLASFKRQSVPDNTNKRRSVNMASPTPNSKAGYTSRSLRSPTRSPTKQIATKSAMQIFSKPNNSASAKAVASSVKRNSMAGRASITHSAAMPSTSRLSIGTGPSLASRAPVPAKKPLISRPASLQSSLKSSPPQNGIAAGRARAAPHEKRGGNTSSNDSGSVEGEEILEKSTVSKPRLPETDSAYSNTNQHVRPLANMAKSTTPVINLNREIDELKTKLKIADKKRLEDREKLKNVEKLQLERDKFEGIIQKLQAKMQPQQQEILDLKKQLKESEEKALAEESRQAEFDTTLEMATLDREMAEETAEAFKTELETIRSRNEELELEVEILREENIELGKEMSPEERTSQGWLQMERSNERLREALIRLRDMTQEQEAEFKDQIQELQSHNIELSSIREQCDDLKAQLNQKEHIAEELKQQLDSALGAEEMIEELTEKNMMLIEKIDELKVIIEDLESLRELNDELELNHIENEKQLQDEVNYYEAMYLEQIRKYNSQEEALIDLEYTVSRFRELVGNLQSDLEEIRASQQISEHETSELNSRSKAVMDLNLRLQASVSKAQNKAIEVELGRLEAEQALNHLDILENFLSDSYTLDKDSISAFLRVKRINFKAGLLHSFVKERVTGVPSPGHEEDVFAACIVLDELCWVSAMSRRFVKFIETCSLESFKRFEGALYDLDPVERTINGWIGDLKQDELREQECASELKRSIAVMSHLAEVHIPDSLQTFAEHVIMQALLIQSRLDNAAAAVAQMKQISQARVILPTDADEEDEAAAERFLGKADALISQIQSLKVVANKIVGQLEELQSRSLTLNPATQPSIEQAGDTVMQLVSSCQISAFSLLKVIGEEGRIAPFTYEEISKAISPGETLVFGQLLAQSQIIATHVQNFLSLSTTLAQTVEFTAPSAMAPWKALSQKLKDEANALITHEKEVFRLRDELAEKSTTVAIKDKAIEELNVSIEVLSKRVNESNGRKERLKELEISIEASRSKEQETASRLASIQRQYSALELERETWSTQVMHAGLSDSNIKAMEGANMQRTDIESKGERELANFKLKRISTSLRRVRQGYNLFSASKIKTQLSQPLTSAKQRAASDLKYGSWRNRIAEPTQYKIINDSEMAYLAVSRMMDDPSFKMARIEELQSEQRLLWRPVRSYPDHEIEQQRFDFGRWEQIRDNSKHTRRWFLGHEMAVATKECNRFKKSSDAVASIGIRLRKKSTARDIKIVEAEEWAETERWLGV